METSTVPTGTNRVRNGLRLQATRRIAFVFSIAIRLSIAVIAVVLSLMATVNPGTISISPGITTAAGLMLLVDSWLVHGGLHLKVGHVLDAARLIGVVIVAGAMIVLTSYFQLGIVMAIGVVAAEVAPTFLHRRRQLRLSAPNIHDPKEGYLDADVEVSETVGAEMIDHVHDDPNIVQCIQRAVDPEGRETIVGYFRFVLDAGQQAEIIHVPFCPALKCAPEVYLSHVEGAEVTVKAAQVERFGVRIEAKRSQTEKPSGPILVELIATEGVPVSNVQPSEQKSVA